MNISSIIIKTKRENLESCAKELNKINGVEVALKEDSTIIAIIEASDTSEEIRLLKLIEQTQFVLSAAMHYTYFEDELKDEIAQMQSEVPEILNDDSVPLEKIKYSGSVDAMIKKNKNADSKK